MGVNFFCRKSRDAKFLLFEHLKVEKLQSYENFRDLNPKTLGMVVEEALKFSKEVLGPTMQDGDREGCRYENGSVRMPESYHRAWKLFAETGWVGLACSPEYGGQGLPMVIAGVISEFFQGANCTIAIGAELTAGAAGLIESFGLEEDKKLFVEKMYTGQWSGTMALTEPDAGSDLSFITTEAILLEGAEYSRIYRMEGNKQYITWGQQDLSENIIHLVLARIRGAEEGIKGLSLFIVPKYWVQQDGRIGEDNHIFCSGIEHKMGQHGAPTCSLTFGYKGICKGILLGSATDGISKMFQMMNELRLYSGLQGLALASAAYDVAKQYAKDRVQGSLFKDPRGPAVPIVQHEDVRRMLMNMKAGTEALRAFAGMCFLLSDCAKNDQDETFRKRAKSRLEFFIPIFKSCGSDFSYELIRDAIQIFGGAGYCRDFPVEQYSRDCKITSIVEGTSYIQANDLIKRKLNLGRGKDNVLTEWLEEIGAFGTRYCSDPDFAGDCLLIQEAALEIKRIADKLTKFFNDGNQQLVPLNATRLVECVGEITMAQLIIEQGIISRDKLIEIKVPAAEKQYYHGKIETAHFFCRNILPRIFARRRIIEIADCSALNIHEEAL